MKRAQWGLVVLCVGMTAVSGCRGNKPVNTPGSGVSSAALTSAPKYRVSAKDAFHPNSAFESARKRTLTSFGVITVKTPAPTPTASIATEIISQRKDGAHPYVIVIMDNAHTRKTSFPFDYENDVTALKKLYAMHNLAEVVRSDRTEMENLAALAVYTNTFLGGGVIPENAAKIGPSAFDITRKRREQNLSGGSDVHAALFCQIALSCGFTARMVSMHTFDEAGRPLTHDVGEVYVNDFKKWVVFDPISRATYYVKNAIPLSAIEIHTMVVENRVRDISVVPGIGDPLDFVSVREKLLPRYRFIYMWRMNDFLGQAGSWESLYPSHLVWEDRLSLVSDGGFEKIPRFSGGVKYATHTRDDFEWDLNQTTMTIAPDPKSELLIYLDTVTPNFSGFEVRAGDATQKAESIYRWSGITGFNACRSVNALGMRGAVSFAQIMP